MNHGFCLFSGVVYNKGWLIMKHTFLHWKKKMKLIIDDAAIRLLAFSITTFFCSQSPKLSWEAHLFPWLEWHELLPTCWLSQYTQLRSYVSESDLYIHIYKIQLATMGYFPHQPNFSSSRVSDVGMPPIYIIYLLLQSWANLIAPNRSLWPPW